ncbi:MAG: sugar phosphate isomerase/epimerase [Lachnospiraceae bacterium]|nr:sugar phosphate isomerase/epimerase [Lachnospiraceae bacterium]
MDIKQIAINTESFLDYLDNDADIRKALAAIRSYGYESVEIWHVKGPENGASWKPFLCEAGLSCAAIHELYEEVMEDPAATIKKAKELGAQFIAIGRSLNVNWEDEASIREFAAGMNAFGKDVKDAGMRLLYHNHSSEFPRIGEKNGLDIFFENTDPELVGSELDAYWVQLSGANPLTWIKKLTGRLGIVHLKDIDVVSQPGTFIRKHVCCAIGQGNMETPEIIAAAQAAGCRLFAIETCTDWKDNDSLRCAKESFEYLAAL